MPRIVCLNEVSVEKSHMTDIDESLKTNLASGSSLVPQPEFCLLFEASKGPQPMVLLWQVAIRVDLYFA